MAPQSLAAAPRRARRPAPRGLPVEVLVGGAGGDDPARVFVEHMEEWRRGLGWSHHKFAAYLGVSEGFWRRLRRDPEELTLLVAQRVIDERPEFEYFLGDAGRFFAEKRRRRRRKAHGGAPAGAA